LRLVRRLCFFDESLKTRRIINGDIGQHFPVQINSSPLQAADELAVGNLGITACRIDSHNPKRAKVTLFEATADIAVTEGFLDGFLRRAIQLRLGKKIAFC